MSDSDELWNDLYRMHNQEMCQHENVNDMLAGGIKQFSVCADCGKVWGPDEEESR
jgi:hypothetical protein